MDFLFSVVIPLYNKADTIERTLKSVRSQTYCDFEVVVVDDGSRDDSVKIVEGFKGIRNLRLICQKNAGVSAARNRGVKETCGRYVAFLDADDEWLPNHLADVEKVIANHPNAVIIGCGYKWSGPKFEYSTRTWRRGNVDFIKEYAHYQPTHTSSIAIRRDAVIEAGGFDSRFSFYEDVDLFFKVAVRHADDCYVRGVPSAIYHSDASIKLTSREGLQHFMWDYPHLRQIEELIAKGNATAGMKKFMRWQLLRSEVDHYWAGDLEYNVKLVKAFPCSAERIHRFFAGKDFFVVRRLIARMLGLGYRLVFYVFVRRRNRCAIEIEN